MRFAILGAPAMITGSKIHRVWKCPPSIVLPQIESDDPSPAAERGSAIHAYLERVRLIGVEAALAEAPAELRVLLRCINIDELPTNLATEAALAYDYRARTARELGRNIGRDYAGHLERTGQAPIGPTEIPLTIDLIGGETRPSGLRRGYVGDYKSGYTKYPAPDRFGQTLLAALCIQRIYQCDEVVLELLYVRSDGDHFTARRTCDEWDLETFADELEAAFDLVTYAAEEYRAGRGVAVREGPHCDYCPAFKHCPAKVALIKSIPAELAAMPEDGAISVVRAAEIWMTAERIEGVLKRVKAEITGLAMYQDIELPDGRVIGRLVTRRESLNGRVTAGVLEQWYGPDAVAEAVEPTVTKEALRAVVVKRKAEGEVIQSKKGTGVLDRVLAEIRTRGGIEESVTDSIRPHVPRRLKS